MRSIIRRMISAVRTHTWPWFLVAALLLIVGFVLHDDIPQSMVRSAAVFLFLASCIRQVGALVRDNPTSAEMITRRSIEAGIAGTLADEAAARRRRRAARRANEPDPRVE